MAAAKQMAPEMRHPDHSSFSRPLDVVQVRTIVDADKRRILLDWLQDEFALLVADNEGMVGARSPRPDLVRAALLELSSGQEAWQRSARSPRS